LDRRPEVRLFVTVLRRDSFDKLLQGVFAPGWDQHEISLSNGHLDVCVRMQAHLVRECPRDTYRQALGGAVRRDERAPVAGEGVGEVES